jgi:hypothetical protein
MAVAEAVQGPQRPFDGDGLALLIATYRDLNIPLEVRLACATQAAAYERPKLSPTAMQDQQPGLTPEQRQKRIRELLAALGPGTIEGAIEATQDNISCDVSLPAGGINGENQPNSGTSHAIGASDFVMRTPSGPIAGRFDG